MRVLLTGYGQRGNVEPLVALAVRLRELGAEVRVCAPSDEEFDRRAAGVGVEIVPLGPSVRQLVTGATPPTGAGVPGRAAELIAVYLDEVGAAAEGCDALVASGVVPAAAAARSVADSLGIRYAYASFQPVSLPSPHYRPQPRPGGPFPPEVTDNMALWDLDARSVNTMFGEALGTHRASIGLPPVTDVRDYAFTDRPWLAADPTLGPWQKPAGLDVVQTGAWILPDERPLPAELVAFLNAGTPPVYVGFGSMPLRTSQDIARTAVEAIRAQGHRLLVSRGWAGLTPIDDGDDCLSIGETNHQALFGRVTAVVHHGGAGTTTTAARAGVPQVVIPQAGDQPYWASRVADLGIGTSHDGPEPTLESLSAALERALAPETRTRAKAVAGEIRTDGTTTAARLLHDLAATS